MMTKEEIYEIIGMFADHEVKVRIYAHNFEDAKEIFLEIKPRIIEIKKLEK